MARTYLKQRLDAPPGFFACEAAGLDWLRVPKGPQVARVLSVGATELELEFLTSTAPTQAAAHDFGRRLARLHQTPAPGFGSVPENWGGDWFFGPLHQVYELAAVSFATWPEFFARARLEPLRELLAAGGHFDAGLDQRLDQVARGVESGSVAGLGQGAEASQPVRVHGDLWSGNLMWTASGAVLIDPAAHGNHPYTDLAMLELFGCPHLDAIWAGYFESCDLSPPTPAQLALHQIFPIGMHVVIFGDGYRPHLDDLLVRALQLDI